ncbi:hypothetical protein V8F33_008109 [Rhypophila sp. PSN 637]
MFSQKKPYSAITVDIDRLTSETFQENDLSGLPELVEAINLQDTGPAEAARAIRKKLKYGNLHRQLRALTILDALIQNAGPRFQRNFANEPLLERLRFAATAHLSDPEVKEKCEVLFRSWAANYKNTRGMERVANLSKELPRRLQAVTQETSKVLKATENPFGDDEDEQKPSGPSQPSHSRKASSISNPTVTGTVLSFSSTKEDKKKKDKKSKKQKPFNLEAEKAQMKTHIAESLIASNNLMNTLKSTNRQNERISQNQTAVQRVETCKQLRRKLHRYIYHVESEEFLGSLLEANDQLTHALLTFEQLDTSIDADSDSDDDLAEQAHLYRMATEKAKGKEVASPTSPGAPVSGMAGLNLNSEGPAPPKPPRRPSAPPRPSAAKPVLTSPSTRPRQYPPSDEESEAEDNDDEDDNPFSDQNAVVNPK